MSSHVISPAWMRWTLYAAGAYNIAWGIAVVAFPLTPWNWFGMAPPRYPELWQCIGMIVGVYGVGYGIAAAAPYHHWPIVLVGLLGKVFGPIGFVQAAVAGRLPWSFGLINLFNDLIWWIPFAAILWGAYRARHGELANASRTTPPAAGRSIP